VVGSLVIVLLQIFSWFSQWKNFENRLIFDELKAYKKWCHFWGPPCTLYTVSDYWAVTYWIWLEYLEFVFNTFTLLQSFMLCFIKVDCFQCWFFLCFWTVARLLLSIFARFCYFFLWLLAYCPWGKIKIFWTKQMHKRTCVCCMVKLSCPGEASKIDIFYELKMMSFSMYDEYPVQYVWNLCSCRCIWYVNIDGCGILNFLSWCNEENFCATWKPFKLAVGLIMFSNS